MKIYLRFIFLFILTFIFGAGRALAEEETIDFTTKYSSKQTIESTSGTYCIVTYKTGSGQTGYFTSDKSVHIYGKGGFTVASTTRKITQIKLYFVSDNNKKYQPVKNEYTISSGSLTTTSATQTWTTASNGGVSSVTFNNSNSSGHWRLQKIVVTYAADTRTATTTTFTGVENGKMSLIQGYSFTSPTASVMAGTTPLTNATLDYSSSKETVATVTSDGTLTLKGAGTTTITATYNGDTNYLGSFASYTLVVADHETDTFNYNEKDILNHGGNLVGDTINASRTVVTMFANRANGDTKSLNIYGNNIHGVPFITFTAKEGYAISGIKLTAIKVDDSYAIQTWKDENNNYLTINDATATWSGFATSVTITNLGTSMAQLTSIAVDYAKLNESESITISESGKGTYCPTANCIIGNGTVTKYITGTESNGTTLTEQDAPIVAAGEGVLLNGKAGPYKVYTHEKLTATKNENNKLVGCTEETSRVPKGCYVMQNHNNVVAFYIVNSDNFTASKGKAYLKLGTTNQSKVKALFFNNDETTGIFSPAVEEEVSSQENIYTLSGTKVDKANMKKGIYIVNGKKYVVK